jgi:hypothetical protein
MRLAPSAWRRQTMGSGDRRQTILPNVPQCRKMSLFVAPEKDVGSAGGPAFLAAILDQGRQECRPAKTD